jgi:DNA-binding Lrp family transcriptional regulator
MERMAFIRLPRFNRSAKVPSIRLTPRDREILQHIHRHRFLRSDHLAVLLPGSPQQILRRLQRLYHHGFLERPRCQIDYYQSGSRRMAYGIGNKGAASLKRELALPYHRLDWGQKNRVTRLFLEHALLVSDVMVALEVTRRNKTDVRLITSDEIKLPGDTGRKREPFQWTVNIGGHINCGIIPDRVFGLEFTDKSGRKNSSWFFLEADRATMPVRRAGLDRSSFYRKLLAYEATWKQNIHRTRFGWRRFRVLTVTTGEERMDHLIEACRNLKHGHGMFLFTHAGSLSSCLDLFSLRWQTVRPEVAASLLE